MPFMELGQRYAKGEYCKRCYLDNTTLYCGNLTKWYSHEDYEEIPS
ncbi:hypothetical protein SLEP1_g45300 [Rubroshorea leprosula]|uniref:Uncharacterized protein n=1 Tax=Rubroshorea leprosula TaxID=152421 RepID=A0AAV5LIR7_9ROSI|nr:hypothetical protein SLEP1_g45300 [Rubroshorea leprosula]